MEEEGFEFLVNVNHPWLKFSFGWEYIEPTEDDKYHTLFIHVAMFTFILNWWNG